MIDKALTAIAGAAALATAAAVGVVAGAFALFFGFSVLVGPALAAAIVAGAAFLFVLVAVLMVRGGKGPRRRMAPPADDPSLISKAVELARDHPLLAVGAAVGAGIYAMRNPQLVAAVVTAFMAGKDERK